MQKKPLNRLTADTAAFTKLLKKPTKTKKQIVAKAKIPKKISKPEFKTVKVDVTLVRFLADNQALIKIGINGAERDDFISEGQTLTITETI